MLPGKRDVWNEEHRIEEHSEQIVEASDETTDNALWCGICQFCSVLEEENASDSDEASAQDCRQVELSFAERNSLEKYCYLHYLSLLCSQCV